MSVMQYMLGKILYFCESKKRRLMHYYLQEKYRKRAKRIGKCVRFNGVSYIGNIENMEIGNNVHIGDNAYISALGGVYIGDNTHISRNFVLYTDNHRYEGTLLPYDDTFVLKKVVIEKNVWIGMNVTVLPGTHIEEGAVIGAGSVVKGRIEKYAVVGAAPAHVIRHRDAKRYETLEKARRYGGVNGRALPEECK
jgi:maltose O-acetyltransferase